MSYPSEEEMLVGEGWLILVCVVLFVLFFIFFLGAMLHG